jgi:hypothetical protein
MPDEEYILSTHANRKVVDDCFVTYSGDLAIRDITLVPGTQKSISLPRPSILWPIIGDLRLDKKALAENSIYTLDAGTCTLFNTYPDNAINALIIDMPSLPAMEHLHEIPIENIQSLLPHWQILNLGHKEVTEIITDGQAYVYTVLGVVEVNDRLLHTRDAMQVSGVSLLELQAFEEDTVVLVISER